MGSESAGSELGVWLNHSQQVTWRRLLAIRQRFEERLDQELKAAHGLSLGDYAVLVHLSEAPEQALRMSELAEVLVLSRSGLTRRVDGLVREGLVIRRACPADGRGAYAQLTSAGAAVLSQAAPTHVCGVRRYLIDALGPDRLRGLAEGLDAIDEALGGTPALDDAATLDPAVGAAGD